MVLKFGGTSVSSLPNWNNIARIAAERAASGARVLIVHSAFCGITDRLERLLDAAIGQAQEEELRAIEERHRRLAAELGVPIGTEVERQLAELREIAAGIALVGEVSDRTRARVMAAGELMATHIGARWLSARGLAVAWADVRTMLRAERQGASAKASVLSAVCGFAPDAALRARLGEGAPIVLTQGFIASDDEGNTVLLGRGGSDTSAAYLAAKLSAPRLEIWTDVPGMFSANPRSTPSARSCCALHYDEAQEIATSGAKVLHPRCILPAASTSIPLHVLRHAGAGPAEGTVLSADGGDGGAQVKAVCIKKGITLIAWKARACGTRSAFSPMPSRCSRSTACPWTWSPLPRPTSPSRSIRPPTRWTTRCSSADHGAVAIVPRAGDRSVRLGEPRRAQHPRHPAPAGGRLRVLRGTEDLPREPGRQRSELHLRRG
jgi:diaminopimelate decarboxylase/aspartate kinase